MYSKLIPFLWLAAVAAAYAGLGAWFVVAADAVRRRKAEPALLPAALLPVLAAGFALASFRLPALPRLAAADALLAGLDAAIWLGIIRPRMTWERAKAQKEDARQSVLHLTLLTGSAIFILPFLWLLLTSLKEERDMFTYPPVLVPRQQVMLHTGGKDVGLAKLAPSGDLVGEVQEGDTTWRVRRVQNNRLVGPVFSAQNTSLTEIRHFDPVWRNYSDALNYVPPETDHGLLYLSNTVLVTLLNIFGTLLSSSLVAFAFARLRWPGRDILFLVMLSTMMLPGAVTLIPVFLIFKQLGWINTLRPLWIGSFFAAPFNVFLLRQFFLTIPNDLEDAAKIDGCSYLRIYWTIMLPLVKPALAALTILAFMGSWNNFMGPLIYLSSPSKMTLAYALRLFQSSHSAENGMMMAAATMVMLPVLIVFFFTQRYFIQGITLTGMKG